MKNFIDLTRSNPANADTNFYLYAAWGLRNDQNTNQPFFEAWSDTNATLDGNFVATKERLRSHASRIEGRRYNVKLIPAAHAFIAVIDAIRMGVRIENDT